MSDTATSSSPFRDDPRSQEIADLRATIQRKEDRITHLIAEHRKEIERLGRGKFMVHFVKFMLAIFIFLWMIISIAMVVVPLVVMATRTIHSAWLIVSLFGAMSSWVWYIVVEEMQRRNS